MRVLKDVESYVDGEVYAFSDGEVLVAIHMGFNRIGREWHFDKIQHEGSLVKSFIEPTHLFASKHPCKVFNDREAYDVWYNCMSRRFVRDALEEIGEYDMMRKIRDTIPC